MCLFSARLFAAVFVPFLFSENCFFFVGVFSFHSFFCSCLLSIVLFFTYRATCRRFSNNNNNTIKQCRFNDPKIVLTFICDFWTFSFSFLFSVCVSLEKLSFLQNGKKKLLQKTRLKFLCPETTA